MKETETKFSSAHKSKHTKSFRRVYVHSYFDLIIIFNWIHPFQKFKYTKDFPMLIASFDVNCMSMSVSFRIGEKVFHAESPTNNLRQQYRTLVLCWNTASYSCVKQMSSTAYVVLHLKHNRYKNSIFDFNHTETPKDCFFRLFSFSFIFFIFVLFKPSSVQLFARCYLTFSVSLKAREKKIYTK